MPSYFALILRAFSVIEGIALRVDPQYSIVQETFPYLARRLLTDNSPRTRAALRQLLYGVRPLSLICTACRLEAAWRAWSASPDAVCSVCCTRQQSEQLSHPAGGALSLQYAFKLKHRRVCAEQVAPGRHTPAAPGRRAVRLHCQWSDSAFRVSGAFCYECALPVLPGPAEAAHLAPCTAAFSRFTYSLCAELCGKLLRCRSAV